MGEAIGWVWVAGPWLAAGTLQHSSASLAPGGADTRMEEQRIGKEPQTWALTDSTQLNFPKTYLCRREDRDSGGRGCGAHWLAAGGFASRHRRR